MKLYGKLIFNKNYVNVDQKVYKVDSRKISEVQTHKKKEELYHWNPEEINTMVKEIRIKINF